MCAQSIAKQDSTTAIAPSIRPAVPWRAISVYPLDGYRLYVEFTDGTNGEVRMDELISSPSAGVFSSLADLDLFRAVHLEHGAVTWPGEIDLAPDAMYEQIRANGRWVLK
ncbi:MAG: DUF2442 domain-containing protein [Acidithiobacillus sp.]|mgnify:CR=1 FL=1|nr:DUF2442 domain-containing protein [Acidithiobacillus sp.]